MGLTVQEIVDCKLWWHGRWADAFLMHRARIVRVTCTVLKEVDGDLVIAALHMGGKERLRVAWATTSDLYKIY